MASTFDLFGISYGIIAVIAITSPFTATLMDPNTPMYNIKREGKNNYAFAEAIKVQNDG
ncbi:hypothetical protein [Psychromonas antarctica]|uniref:hypothetical protein n=1 Tax=Psychromonas antarctica TaxID=67573 RepID=UPI001EE8B1AC|nr:hypothetical protein [Psychromonas antarctica]MCG6202088.1 hypothetical protein [Psychromonas antarctica]